MENLYVLYVFIFFTFVLNVVNFLFTYKRLTKKEVILYTYLLLSILGWFGCNAGADLIKEPNIAIFFAKLAIIFPVNLANAIFQITRIFPQSFKSVFNKKAFMVANIIVVCITTFLLVFLNSPANITEIFLILDGPISYVPGELYFVSLFGGYFLLVLACISWFGNFKDYTKIQKKQILLFAIVMFFVSISLVLGLLLMPSRGLPQYAPTMFLSLSLWLFVTNQNLLTKGFMPNVSYDLGILIWGMICSGVGTAFIFTVTQYQGSLTFFSIFLLTLMLLGALLTSYKKVVTFLRKDYHGIEDEVLKFANRTTVILDKEKILEELKYTLDTVFPKAQCKIVLEGQNGSSLFKNLKKWWTSLKTPLITTQEIIIEQFVLKKVEEVLTKDLYGIFKKKNIDLVIPLNIGDRLGGMMVMKDLDRVLGIKEHEILNLLAENASVAISRAILYEEVEEFSKKLQAKVDEQTKELRSRMESMEEMRQRERDLLDIMGHELRTPLTIVRNSLDLIEIYKKKQKKKRKNIKWNADFQKQFEYIKAAVRREMGIVETLLSATKLDAKKMDTHITEVDLVKVVETALLGFENEALKKGLKVKVDMNLKKNWIVKADSLQIQQVVDNLFSNAVKYTHKGSVKISLKDLGNKISIAISDSGEGMAKEDIKKLGTKFFRLNQYVSTNGEDEAEKGLVRPGGTGLGLYVALGLIKLMGGTYEIESELGKGSTFIVIFKKP